MHFEYFVLKDAGAFFAGEQIVLWLRFFECISRVNTVKKLSGEDVIFPPLADATTYVLRSAPQ